MQYAAVSLTVLLYNFKPNVIFDSRTLKMFSASNSPTQTKSGKYRCRWEMPYRGTGKLNKHDTGSWFPWTNQVEITTHTLLETYAIRHLLPVSADWRRTKQMSFNIEWLRQFVKLNNSIFTIWEFSSNDAFSFPLANYLMMSNWKPALWVERQRRNFRETDCWILKIYVGCNSDCWFSWGSGRWAWRWHRKCFITSRGFYPKFIFQWMPYCSPVWRRRWQYSKKTCFPARYSFSWWTTLPPTPTLPMPTLMTSFSTVPRINRSLAHYNLRTPAIVLLFVGRWTHILIGVACGSKNSACFTTFKTTCTSTFLERDHFGLSFLSTCLTQTQSPRRFSSILFIVFFLLNP